MNSRQNHKTLLTSKLKACKPALGLLAGLLFAAPLAHAAMASPLDQTSSATSSIPVWSSNNSYGVNDIVSYGGSLYINISPTAPVTKTTPATKGTNLFDKTAVVDARVINWGTGGLFNCGGFQSSGFINLGGASSFVTNITINIFEIYGVAFFDANSYYLSGTQLNGNGAFPAGVPIPVPAGAQYVRFWWQNGVMGTTVDQAIVNAGTTLQTTYTPYGTGGSAPTTTTTPAAAPTDTTHWSVYTAPTTPSAAPAGAAAAPLPWAGKKMFMLGDSIVWANPGVAGQIATAIGATLSSQGATAPGVDAFPGRTFDAFQNGQGPTGVYLPLSPSVIADVDLMLIALGTNQDSSAGLGTITDAPSLSGTMSAQLRSMLETIMSWKPGMRIIVVGPYQTNRYNLASGTDGLLAPWNGGLPIANPTSISTLRNINAAMKAVCALYGIPYIDTYDQSGVNFTTAALWLGDGLHPNATGYKKFYVPYISAQLGRFAQ